MYATFLRSRHTQFKVSNGDQYNIKHACAKLGWHRIKHTVDTEGVLW